MNLACTMKPAAKTNKKRKSAPYVSDEALDHIRFLRSEAYARDQKETFDRLTQVYDYLNR